MRHETHSSETESSISREKYFDSENSSDSEEETFSSEKDSISSSANTTEPTHRTKEPRNAKIRTEKAATIRINENQKTIENENELEDKRAIHPRRLTYILNLIETVFDNIFNSIEVNINYKPKDLLEEERSSKRLKDFNCRVQRMIYQAKQNFATLNNKIAKAEFQNRNIQNVEEKLAQIFVSVKGNDVQDEKLHTHCENQGFFIRGQTLNFVFYAMIYCSFI